MTLDEFLVRYDRDAGEWNEVDDFQKQDYFDELLDRIEDLVDERQRLYGRLNAVREALR